jgi:hypothetical protein
MEKFDAQDAARKKIPQPKSELAQQVEKAIAQFETEGKPIVPSVIEKHLGVSGRLSEVVSLVRSMGYETTQDIDPISHMLICRLQTPKEESEPGGFTPKEDEALKRTLDRMTKGRMIIMPFSMADMVRQVMPIGPKRCREWLEAHGWVERAGQGWVNPSYESM